MKILITGCGGMLGEAVYPELSARHEVLATDIDLNEEWLKHLDVRVPDEVDEAFQSSRPDLVLHLAALTDMEYCEAHPAQAYRTNFLGTNNVAQAAIRSGARMVYISSAGVFDGKKQIYTESDVPNPINVYACSKYAGELAAMACPRAMVIRAGWMMGGGPKKDKKFINKIMTQITAGAKEIFVVDDKFGTPTYTYELASTISRLIDGGGFGIFHGACDGSGSRLDVAKEMVEALGLQGEVAVTAVKSEYFKKRYFALRPYSEKLVSTKLYFQPASWQDCLRDYLQRFEWMP